MTNKGDYGNMACPNMQHKRNEGKRHCTPHRKEQRLEATHHARTEVKERFAHKTRQQTGLVGSVKEIGGRNCT